MFNRILAIVALLGFALPLHQVRAGSWRLETVEVLRLSASPVPTSLTLDDHQAPHVLYMRDGQLVHAVKKRAGWTTEVVEGAPAGPSPALSEAREGWFDVVNKPQIAARAGRIHIAYLGRPYGLHHAMKSSGRWSFTTVDHRASSSTQILSLTLDDDGDPHVSYGAYPSHIGQLSLKYGYESSGVWHTERVESGLMRSGKANGRRSALRVDGKTPHLAISDGRGFLYEVRYASISTEWFIETVSSDGGEVVSIDLDSNGVPHVAWATHNVVHHAWRVGEDEWRFEEFYESAEPTWSLVSIAVDARDNVHIAHAYNDGLRYLVRTGPGTWKAVTVDDNAIGASPVFGLSLVLDRDGQPHISYVSTSDDLPAIRLVRYASKGP